MPTLPSSSDCYTIPLGDKSVIDCTSTTYYVSSSITPTPTPTVIKDCAAFRGTTNLGLTSCPETSGINFTPMPTLPSSSDCYTIPLGDKSVIDCTSTTYYVTSSTTPTPTVTKDCAAFRGTTNLGLTSCPETSGINFTPMPTLPPSENCYTIPLGDKSVIDCTSTTYYVGPSSAPPTTPTETCTPVPGKSTLGLNVLDCSGVTFSIWYNDILTNTPQTFCATATKNYTPTTKCMTLPGSGA
ncbi:uncharacterized protein VTP21DRAFT_1093 [Calcarisporiella thermophila]|uniref:uncharacterized protein n=1 Tax=Calcarisporiella thermophila TaxID=911321 RepID=UPI0037437C0D